MANDLVLAAVAAVVACFYHTLLLLVSVLIEAQLGRGERAVGTVATMMVWVVIWDCLSEIMQNSPRAIPQPSTPSILNPRNMELLSV